MIAHEASNDLFMPLYNEGYLLIKGFITSNVLHTVRFVTSYVGLVTMMKSIKRQAAEK